uniref:Uncharacterized protein n=1 Tax=Ditylenchus dipsaci TaxID=166011 RepID=A0A915ERR2_9BILA
MSSKIPNETSCEIFGFFSQSECQNQLVVSCIHYSLIAPRLKMVYCYLVMSKSVIWLTLTVMFLESQKAAKIRLHNYIDSPDYPEDLELQLSGFKKVVEDIQSLSDREVSEQFDLLPEEEAKR